MGEMSKWCGLGFYIDLLVNILCIYLYIYMYIIHIIRMYYIHKYEQMVWFGIVHWFYRNLGSANRHEQNWALRTTIFPTKHLLNDKQMSNKVGVEHQPVFAVSTLDFWRSRLRKWEPKGFLGSLGIWVVIRFIGWWLKWVHPQNCPFSRVSC